MIVSHSHKFIFLKPKKSASTSVELALSQICAPGDVITPVKEERLRKGIAPQNYIVPYRDLLWHLGLRRQGVSSPKLVFESHATGREVRRHIGKDIWNSYTKVTIVRNPWDREVSRFFWMQKRPNVPDNFDEFVERITRRHPIGNEAVRWGLYKNGAGFLIRYENLDADYAAFVNSLDVTDVPELPHAHGQSRPKGTRDYREIYTDRSREAIRSIYRREIEALGYEF